MRRIPTTAISTISTQNGGDWTLRAAVLPAGEYDLVMHFEPDSYRSGARISRHPPGLHRSPVDKS